MLGTLVLAASLAGQLGDDERVLIEEILKASEANVEGFSHGRVEFETLRGNSAGDGDLRDRRLEGALRGKGRLLFDGKDALLELAYDDQDVIEGTKVIDKTRSTAAVMPRALLTDGALTLSNILVAEVDRPVVLDHPKLQPDADYAYFRSNANFLYPVGERPFFRNDLAEDCREILDGDAELKAIRVEEAEGGRLARLTSLMATGATHEYVVDLRRGAIPLKFRATLTDGYLMSERLYGDLRHVPGAGWFPCARRVNLPNAHVSEIMSVTRLDFDARPRTDEFTVRFREPVSITDAATGTLMPRAIEYSLAGRR